MGSPFISPFGPFLISLSASLSHLSYSHTHTLTLSHTHTHPVGGQDAESSQKVGIVIRFMVEKAFKWSLKTRQAFLSSTDRCRHSFFLSIIQIKKNFIVLTLRTFNYLLHAALVIRGHSIRGHSIWGLENRWIIRENIDFRLNLASTNGFVIGGVAFLRNDLRE